MRASKLSLLKYCSASDTKDVDCQNFAAWESPLHVSHLFCFVGFFIFYFLFLYLVKNEKVLKILLIVFKINGKDFKTAVAILGFHG